MDNYGQHLGVSIVIGVPPNGLSIIKEKTHLEVDDLGVPLFVETPISTIKHPKGQKKWGHRIGSQNLWLNPCLMVKPASFRWRFSPKATHSWGDGTSTILFVTPGPAPSNKIWWETQYMKTCVYINRRHRMLRWNWALFIALFLFGPPLKVWCSQYESKWLNGTVKKCHGWRLWLWLLMKHGYKATYDVWWSFSPHYCQIFINLGWLVNSEF